MSSNQGIGNVSGSDVTGVNINGDNNNISKKLFVMPSEYHMRAAYLVTVMSIVSLIASIGVVVWMCHKGDSIGFENISFGDASITALGAITAILLGWNIYSVIDIKSIKKDYDKFKDELVQKNKEIFEEYKNELNEENKSLEEAINAMQKQIKSMDVFGENEGKAAKFEFDSIENEKQSQNILNRIQTYYKDLGVATREMGGIKVGYSTLIVINGGISDKKKDALIELLKREFNLNDLKITFARLGDLLGIPTMSKNNN